MIFEKFNIQLLKPGMQYYSLNTPNKPIIHESEEEKIFRIKKQD